MSHTDAHLPYWVRLLDPTRTTAHHNHETHECDLPPTPIPWYNTLHPYYRHCYWELTHDDTYTHPSCGCHMCTNHYQRRWNRRKERYTARKIITDQYLDYLADQHETPDSH